MSNDGRQIVDLEDRVDALEEGGGGGSQTLADTLALGNDAAGNAITGLADPAGPQDAATKAHVAAAIAALVNSAPSALDTLKELDDALGNDASFAATMTAALAAKQPLDADLTAIAAVATTAYGRALLALADGPALLAAAGAASLANRLDQFAAPNADVPWNAKKITGLANGAGAQDAAAFGQIPVFAGARFIRASAALASGSALVFSSVEYDTDNYQAGDASPDFFTVPAGKGGVYDLVAWVAASSGTPTYSVLAQKSSDGGANWTTFTVGVTTGGAAFAMNWAVVGVKKLAAGDRVRLFVFYDDSGVNFTCEAALSLKPNSSGA